MQSLGLGNNPNILTYPEKGWFELSEDMIVEGAKVFGGIWAIHSLSAARNIKKYMKKKHNKDTRIFIVEIGKVLYSTSYRIKTDKVNFLEEFF